MATTINAYSVSLGLDASGYIQGGRLSRQETGKVVAQINAARSPMENFARTYDLLEKALQSGAITLEVYQRLLEAARAKLAAATPVVKTAAQAEREYNQALAETNRLRREFGRTGASPGLARMGTEAESAGTSLVTLAGRFAGPLAAIAGLRAAVSSSFQTGQAMASLEVLTGSAENAAYMLNRLREIDAQSPLTFDAGLQATRTLLSFGVSLDEVIPRLRQLGDVTGADNERFKSMALAFAQVSAAGRLQGQDLRQMVDAGFNPLQEISRKTGESLIDLKVRMEAGAISSREVADAFTSATSEGGKFSGMMDKLGQTAAGKFGQMVSKIQQIGVQIGDALGPVIIQIADLFMAWAPALDYVVWVIKTMGQGLGAIIALMNDLTSMFKWFGATARGEAVSINELLAFENTNKLLDGMNSAKEAGDSLNSTLSTTDAIVGKAAANAERLKQGIEQRKQFEKETAENTLKFEQTLAEMRGKLRSAATGIETNEAEADAIRNLFDVTDNIQRSNKGLFDYWVQNGVDYNKFLDGVLNKEQMAQLESFRSLQQQTQELEKQEKAKQRADELRKRMLKDAMEIMDRADPVAKVARELQDLQTLFRSGMINSRAFELERKRIAGQAVKDSVKIESPKSIEVRSQEAYKFMVDSQNDTANQQLREARETRVLIEAQNRILAAIEKKPVVERRR